MILRLAILQSDMCFDEDSSDDGVRVEGAGELGSATLGCTCLVLRNAFS